MKVPLQSTDRMALIRRCRDLEARGFECISPIRRTYRASKEFSPDLYMKGRKVYEGASESVMWRCMYERKEKAV
jgi:hypothetical protein